MAKPSTKQSGPGRSQLLDLPNEVMMEIMSGLNEDDRENLYLTNSHFRQELMSEAAQLNIDHMRLLLELTYNHNMSDDSFVFFDATTSDQTKQAYLKEWSDLKKQEKEALFNQAEEEFAQMEKTPAKEKISSEKKKNSVRSQIKKEHQSTDKKEEKRVSKRQEESEKAQRRRKFEKDQMLNEKREEEKQSKMTNEEKTKLIKSAWIIHLYKNRKTLDQVFDTCDYDYLDELITGWSVMPRYRYARKVFNLFAHPKVQKYPALINPLRERENEKQRDVILFAKNYLDHSGKLVKEEKGIKYYEFDERVTNEMANGIYPPMPGNEEEEKKRGPTKRIKWQAQIPSQLIFNRYEAEGDERKLYEQLLMDKPNIVDGKTTRNVALWAKLFCAVMEYRRKIREKYEEEGHEYAIPGPGLGIDVFTQHGSDIILTKDELESILPIFQYRKAFEVLRAILREQWVREDAKNNPWLEVDDYVLEDEPEVHELWQKYYNKHKAKKQEKGENSDDTDEEQDFTEAEKKKLKKTREKVRARKEKQWKEEQQSKFVITSAPFLQMKYETVYKSILFGHCLIVVTDVDFKQDPVINPNSWLKMFHKNHYEKWHHLDYLVEHYIRIPNKKLAFRPAFSEYSFKQGHEELNALWDLVGIEKGSPNRNAMETHQFRLLAIQQECDANFVLKLGLNRTTEMNVKQVCKDFKLDPTIVQHEISVVKGKKYKKWIEDMVFYVTLLELSASSRNQSDEGKRKEQIARAFGEGKIKYPDYFKLSIQHRLQEKLPSRFSYNLRAPEFAPSDMILLVQVMSEDSKLNSKVHDRMNNILMFNCHDVRDWIKLYPDKKEFAHQMMCLKILSKDRNMLPYWENYGGNPYTQLDDNFFRPKGSLFKTLTKWYAKDELNRQRMNLFVETLKDVLKYTRAYYPKKMYENTRPHSFVQAAIDAFSNIMKEYAHPSPPSKTKKKKPQETKTEKKEKTSKSDKDEMEDEASSEEEREEEREKEGGTEEQEQMDESD